MKDIKRLVEEINGPATIQFTYRPKSNQKDLQLNINLYGNVWQDLSNEIKWYDKVSMSFPITVVGKKIRIVAVVKEGEDWGRAYISEHGGIKVVWI